MKKIVRDRGNNIGRTWKELKDEATDRWTWQDMDGTVRGSNR